MRVAQIKDGFITNIIKFSEGSIPVDCIDVTDIQGVDIGNPVVDGVVSIQPSPWHTLVNGAWVITPESQVAKDIRDTAIMRHGEIITEQEASGLKGATVQQAKDFIDNQIDSATSVDEMKTAIKAVLKKMVVFLLKED